MPWQIGLVDSCGSCPGSVATCRFERRDGKILRTEAVPDRSGHGTRLARIIGAGQADLSFALAQVLDENGRSSAQAVAEGIDWCMDQGCHLVHLSLGLAGDRDVLRGAIQRAVAARCLVIASVPARGAVPFPGAYRGVLRGTGDARCAPGEISHLAPHTFGGCPADPDGAGGGASVGTAHVTGTLVRTTSPCDFDGAIRVLSGLARWTGPERRGMDPTTDR